MSYVLSEGAMEKLINDVADVRAGQAFLKQSVERMEEKLDKALEEHDERIRVLETYKDKQLGLLISFSIDRKSTRLNSSHSAKSRMPSSA